MDQRFVFLDLDSLLASVRAHVLSHELQFHSQLAQFSSDVALSPEHLTVLLNDQHLTKVQSWRGTYCANPNAAEAKALESVRSDGGSSVDWKLTQKGTRRSRRCSSVTWPRSQTPLLRPARTGPWC